MAQVGIVKEISGIVRAVDASGAVRILVLGDRVDANELVVTIGDGSSIKLSFDSGRELVLGSGEKAFLDESVFSKEGFDDTDVQVAQNALLNGDELPTEATAAGEAGVAGDGGFVSAFIAQRGDSRGDVDSHNTSRDGGALSASFASGEYFDPNNIAPNAIDDNVEARENVLFTGNLLDNDSDDELPNLPEDLDIVSVNNISDINGDGFITITTEFGELSVNVATGDYEYLSNYDSLAYGESVVESFEYVVTDGQLTSTATLNITLNGTNDQPQADVLLGAGWLLKVGNSDYDGGDDYDGDGDQIPFVMPKTFVLDSSVGVDAINDFIATGEGSVVVADALDPSEVPTNGSALKLSIAVTAGETVSFNWSFFDAEEEGQNYYNDFSFVVIDGQEIQLLADAFELGAVNTSIFSYTFANAGIHEITFGVMNEDDTGVSPSLEVIHASGGEIVNVQTIGIVEDSVVNYESSDMDETDTSGDGIVSNDEGMSVLSGSLTATDIDTSDTHIFRLVDVVDEGAILVSYESGNSETNEESEVQILVTSPDINVEDLDIQGITLFNNDQGDRVSDFELRGDFGALGVGESATVTFQFVADDMHGFGDGELPNESSTSEVQVVTMTIVGTNDQPVVENVVINVTEASLEEGGLPNQRMGIEDYTYSGQLLVNDDDVNDMGQHIFEWDPSSIKVTLSTSNAIILDIIAEHGITPIDAETFVESITQGYIDFSYLDENSDNIMEEVTLSTVDIPADLVASLIEMGILVINVGEDGSYSVSSLVFNLLGANDTLTVAFNYRADDTRETDGTDGINENSVSEWATVSLTIEGTNDQPVAYSHEVLAQESSLSNVGNNEDARFEGVLPGGQTDAHDFNALIGRLFSGMDEDALDMITMKYFQGEAEVTTIGTVLNVDGVTPIVDSTQTVVVVNENGTFSIENATFDNLAYGESVTVTFDYYIDDMSDNDIGEAHDTTMNPHEATHSEPQSVTVTITGTNDQPVIQSVATTQANYYEEMGVPSDSEDAREITGSLTQNFFDDDTNDIPNLHYVSIEDGVFNAQDNDELNAAVNLQVINEVYNGNALNINAEDISLDLDEYGNFTLASDKFNSLGEGESLDVTFNVKITDESNSLNGESTESETRLVTIHIEGTNDQPVVSDVFAGGVEQGVVTYVNDIDMRIPSYGTSGTISSTIDIADGGSISDLNVHINLTHTYDNDLDISLMAPDGTTIDLTSDNGGAANNYTNTIFDDEAAISVTAGSAPFNGTFRPEGNLSDFDGMDMSGTWTLIIVDDAGADIGTLHDWSLEFTVDGQQVIYESHDNETYQNSIDDTQDDIATIYIGSLATVVDDDANDTHEYFKVAETESVISEDIDPNLIIDLQITVTTDGEYTVEGNFNALGVGERATVTFDYYTKDSSTTQLNGESNISASKTVTVIITGTNDQPIVENVTLSAIETHDSDAYQNGVDDTQDDVTTTLAGTLNALDDDANDTHIFRIDNIEDQGAITVSYNSGNNEANEESGVQILVTSSDIDVENLDIQGITLLNNDGADSEIGFEIVGNFNVLGVGESAQVTFKYYVDDGQDKGESGDASNEASISEVKLVTITITGTNDQPIIESTEIKEALESDLSAVTYGVDAQLSTNDLVDSLAEGSAVKIVLDTAAGEEVSFDWSFDLRDGDYVGDNALVIVDGVVISLANSTVDANGTFTYTFATAGEHTIAAVVLNNHEDQGFIGSSVLNVTNLSGGEVISSEIFGAVSGSIASGGFDLSANSSLLSADLAAFVSTVAVTYENAHLFGNLDEEALVTVTDDDENDGYTYVAFSDKIITDFTEESSGDEPLITTPIRVSLDADGNYDIVSSSFDKLGEGESVTISFDIQVQDDSGVGMGTSNNETSFSETKTITMVITGTNDQPEIVSIDTTNPISEAALMTDFSIENYYHIANSIDLLSKTILNDEDLNDAHTLELANPRAAWDGKIYSDDAVYQFDLANSNGTNNPLIFQNAGVLQVTAAFLNEYPHIDAEIGDFLLYGSGLNNMGLGETATLTFEVVANDGSSGVNGGESNLSAPYMVTINIVGTNDQPTVTDIHVSLVEVAGTSLSSVEGTFIGTDEDINDTLSYGVVSMDENIPVEDIAGDGFVRVSNVQYDSDGNGIYDSFVDIAVKLESGSNVDLNQINITGLTVNGNNFTLEGDFNTLPEGENLVVSFQYKATDDSGAGAGDGVNEAANSDVKIVTVTITGTNDIAIIDSLIAHGEVAEDSILIDEGYLGITDLDAGEAEFTPINTPNNGTYGTFILGTNGVWQYFLDNEKAQAIGADGATETFIVYSKDGTDSQDVTIAIHGQNDAPLITNETFIFETNELIPIGTIIGTVNATDVDSQILTYSFVDINGIDTVHSIFDIDTSTGEISIASALDYEDITTYNFRVKVSDGSLSDIKTFTVDLANVTADVSGGMISINQNFDAGNNYDWNISDNYQGTLGPVNEDAVATSEFNLGQDYANTEVTITFDLILDEAGHWYEWNDNDYVEITAGTTVINQYATNGDGTYAISMQAMTDSDGKISVSIDAHTKGLFKGDELWFMDNFQITAESNEVLAFDSPTSGTIDFAQLIDQDNDFTPTTPTSLDEIDLSGKSITLTNITAQDVLNITDDDHTLAIHGDSASSVDVSGWTFVSSDASASVYSAVYNDYTVTLQVDNDLVV